MNKFDQDFNWSNIPDNFFSAYSGLVIKKKRKELGISGRELAKRLNISQQQISRYERGINKMTLDLLLNVSIVLAIPFESLINSIISEVKSNYSSDASVLKTVISMSEPVYFY